MVEQRVNAGTDRQLIFFTCYRNKIQYFYDLPIELDLVPSVLHKSWMKQDV